MSRNVHCTYISEKVSKIRWKPNALTEPNSFVTASWDNCENHIRLWEIAPNYRSEIDDEATSDGEINPVQIRDLALKSDITEMKFVNDDTFVVSTSDGDVYLLRITANERCEVEIQEEISWKSIHQIALTAQCACTSLAVYDSDMATVGEDGRINLLSINQRTRTASIADADSCSINCVEFVRYNELLTANIRGQFKIWDIRNHRGGDQPAQTFLLHADAIIAPTCVVAHPTQRHIIATGDEVGKLAIWDLRHNTFPLNVIQQNNEAFNEVLFHPDCPEQIFSCAGGDVFQWTATKDGGQQRDVTWYLQPSGLAKYEIFQLMQELFVPIKTIDIQRSKLLVGADNEAMYLIDNVHVYGSYDL